MLTLREFNQQTFQTRLSTVAPDQRIKSLWAASRDTDALKPSHDIVSSSHPSAHHAVSSRARKNLPASWCNDHLRAWYLVHPTLHHDSATRNVHAREASCRPPWLMTRHGQCKLHVTPFHQVRALPPSMATSKEGSVRHVSWTAGGLETGLFGLGWSLMRQKSFVQCCTRQT